MRAVSRNHFVNRREREKELVFGQAWKVTKANLSYAKGASDVLWQMDVDVLVLTLNCEVRIGWLNCSEKKIEVRSERMDRFSTTNAARAQSGHQIFSTRSGRLHLRLTEALSDMLDVSQSRLGCVLLSPIISFAGFGSKLS